MIFNGLELQNYGLFGMRGSTCDRAEDLTARCVISSYSGGRTAPGRRRSLRPFGYASMGSVLADFEFAGRTMSDFSGLRSTGRPWERRPRQWPRWLLTSITFTPVRSGASRWSASGTTRDVASTSTCRSPVRERMIWNSTKSTGRNSWPELVPPGLSQLFFFDGEKIQALADDEAGDFELVNSMKALLGLDLTDRLEADLAVYLRRQNEHSDGAAAGDRVVGLQARLVAVNREVRRLHQERAQLEARLGALQKRIREAEGRVSSEGGSFARLREELLSRRAAAETTCDQIEEQIRSLASDFLPFP